MVQNSENHRSLKWKYYFTTTINAAEDHARSWIKREKDQEPEVESLSDWLRTIWSLVWNRVENLKKFVSKRHKSVFNDNEALECFTSLHKKYFIIPADKASNNIVFVCKGHYLKELGIFSLLLLR